MFILQYPTDYSKFCLIPRHGAFQIAIEIFKSLAA
jgi:hypothetical protein